jgi:hypothetical protein
MTPNGPAIWGGCVTRRKRRAESWYFSREFVTVQALPAGRQGGYGTCFCRSGTNFNEYYTCCGTFCLGARKLSWCRILIGGRCASPGTALITNLSWEQEHLPDGRQESKKHDKQLTHIVRVRCSGPLKS